MAEPNGNGLKSFLLGVLVVLVAGLGWYIYSGGEVPQKDKPEITINLPDKKN
ncbi:MAG: hypothetical protein AB7U46_10725 [Paenirhodobacter sp.]|uniref:hypothetical protein n=1 Tax=Paenirhodobacter sp. TaxID=1965326 RepID=UPI003D0C8500